MLIVPEMDQDPYGEGHATDDKMCPRNTEPILRESSSLTCRYGACWLLAPTPFHDDASRCVLTGLGVRL